MGSVRSCKVGQSGPRRSLGSVIQALPTVFVDFAYGSRAGTGYRLLKRAARHSVDPNMADISDMDCRLFEYEGEIGIEFKGVVAASMRSCSYDACVSFTSSQLLCCKCNCPIGAEGDQRVTCVHNLPIMLKFAMLLMDGLAEHVLLELIAKVTITPGSLELLDKNSVLTLMWASGEMVTDLQTKQNTLELLENFSVGTERRKKSVKGIPDPAHIGPIRDMNMKSSNMKVIEKMRQKEEKKEQHDPFNVDSDKISLFEPDYIKILYCLSAKSIEPAKDTLGKQLIELRTQKYSELIESRDGYDGDLFMHGLFNLKNRFGG